jgi:hypothetical protein
VTDLPGIFDGFARVKAFAASVGAAHVVTGHDADALEAGERRGVDHSVIAPLPRG